MNSIRKWNPRFVAYASSQGRDPEEQIVRDREAWPGGYMAGFMLWIREQWRAWSKESGECQPGYDGQGAWWPYQHELFDAWLQEKYRELQGDDNGQASS